MAKLYSIDTETNTLPNVSGVERNKFIEGVCSDNFAGGKGIAVRNVDGDILIVSPTKEIYIAQEAE